MATSGSSGVHLKASEWLADSSMHFGYSFLHTRYFPKCLCSVRFSLLSLSVILNCMGPLCENTILGFLVSSMTLRNYKTGAWVTGYCISIASEKNLSFLLQRMFRCRPTDWLNFLAPIVTECRPWFVSNSSLKACLSFIFSTSQPKFLLIYG